MVQSLDCTGTIKLLGTAMSATLGHNPLLSSLTILAILGLSSGFVPNIPLIAAMVPLLKNYLLSAGITSQAALTQGATAMPAEALVFFYALMFGGTLGGNLTMLGASSNIIACGICAQKGLRITFTRFLRH